MRTGERWEDPSGPQAHLTVLHAAGRIGNLARRGPSTVREIQTKNNTIYTTATYLVSFLEVPGSEKERTVVAPLLEEKTERI